MYFFAHGMAGAKPVGDAAGIGASTVTAYLREFCAGTFRVLKPIYMPCTPPAAEIIETWRLEAAGRRGIGNCPMACDGTHVPFRPERAEHAQDYKCYKGFYSILVLAFVNPFHLFVDGDVGAAGRSGDNTVLRNSWLMKQIEADRDAWLGQEGYVCADGGASDGVSVCAHASIACARLS